MTPIHAELVVGGSHVQAEAGHEPLPVTNPANQEVVGYAPIADPSLVDDAVTQASRAFPTWSTTPAPQRSSRLFAIASWIRANRDRLASTLTLEQGKPLGEATFRGGRGGSGVRLLRGRSGARLRTDHPDGVSHAAQLRPPPAARGSSGHHDLELPARALGLENSPGPGGGLHCGRQTGGGNAAGGARPRGRGDRFGPSVGGAQLRQWRRGDRRDAARQPSKGCDDQFHWWDSHGEAPPRAGSQRCQAGHPGARGSLADDRQPGRPDGHGGSRRG